MPTLQRYKKLYQSRIPSVGKGRKQRYPESALAVFAEIKKENVGRRGRPRKVAAGAVRRGRKPQATKPAKSVSRGRKPAAKKSTRRGRKVASKQRGSGLLTLTEISKRTKISYPTLVRYVKLHLKKIPHEGSGRKRRFHPEAVEVFTKLRAESGRGRKPGRKPSAAKRKPGIAAAAGDGALGARVQSLEKSHNRLEKQIQRLIKSIERPLRLTITRGR
jgi:excisionase family DNA binding protein